MNRAIFNRAITALIGVLLAASSASARTLWPVDGMTWYGGDFAGWSAAAGDFTTINFTEFPPAVLDGDEYAALGATFTQTPGGLGISGGSANQTQDGFGLHSYWWYIEVSFSEPIYSFAYHGGGALNVYSGDTTIAWAPWASGTPAFGGVTSTTPFDRVWIKKTWSSNPTMFIDNIYFSTTPIPAPGAAALLLGALACAGRRRR